MNKISHNILNRGEYLGTAFQSYESDHLLVKSTIHHRSESEFHSHRNAYLSILLSGTYSEISENDKNRIYPGNVIFRSAEYIHKNTFDTNETKCFNAEFHAEWFTKYDLNHRKGKPRIRYISNYPFLFQLLIDFLKYNMIDFTEDLLLDFINQYQKDTIPLRTPWLQKLMHILNNEIDDVHSLKSLSERVFVHQNYMCRVFKEKVGVSIGQYQIEKKLHCAIKKLFCERRNIAAVGLECGFFDESHFIRTFKAHYGITPYQFRLLLNS